MTALIELYANNAYSTLGSPITSTSQTTITVTNGSVFPSPTGNQFFRLTITLAATPNTSIEIVWVTARSGNTLTVIRGQEGTSATTWIVGSLIGNEATKGTYNQFVQPYTGIDTGAANAYVVNTPQHESAYYTGMPCTFYTSNTNTVTAPTLNLNGLGASPIRNYSGGTLVPGQVQANAPISLLYNLANNSWYMQTAIAMPNGFTPSRAIVSNVGGVLSNSSTTSDEIGFVSGVTSPIQTQINNRVLYTDFTESFGVYNSVYSSYNNGYQVLPSGLIIAWMEFKTFTSAAGRTNVSLTFLNGTNTFAFPNAALSWQAVSANGNGIGSPTSVGIGPACTTTTVDLLWDANTVGAFITVMGH